jgi:hypothetical protein
MMFIFTAQHVSSFFVNEHGPMHGARARYLAVAHHLHQTVQTCKHLMINTLRGGMVSTCVSQPCTDCCTRLACRDIPWWKFRCHLQNPRSPEVRELSNIAYYRCFKDVKHVRVPNHQVDIPLCLKFV